jgi:hypothetical protein
MTKPFQTINSFVRNLVLCSNSQITKIRGVVDQLSQNHNHNISASRYKMPCVKHSLLYVEQHRTSERKLKEVLNIVDICLRTNVPSVFEKTVQMTEDGKIKLREIKRYIDQHKSLRPPYKLVLLKNHLQHVFIQKYVFKDIKIEQRFHSIISYITQKYKSNVRQQTAGGSSVGNSEMEDDAEDCPICCNSLNNASLLITTACQHRFHEKCLEKWLDIRSNCPCCRAHIPKLQKFTPEVENWLAKFNFAVPGQPVTELNMIKPFVQDTSVLMEFKELDVFIDDVVPALRDTLQSFAFPHVTFYHESDGVENTQDYISHLFTSSLQHFGNLRTLTHCCHSKPEEPYYENTIYLDYRHHPRHPHLTQLNLVNTLIYTDQWLVNFSFSELNILNAERSTWYIYSAKKDQPPHAPHPNVLVSPQLTYLDLSYCDFYDFYDETNQTTRKRIAFETFIKFVLGQTTPFTSLTTLKLNGVVHQDKHDWQFIKQLFPNLASLHIAHNNLSELSFLDGLTSLKELNIEGNADDIASKIPKSLNLQTLYSSQMHFVTPGN